RIDLRSDTVTKPTPAMRRAMSEAEVGDDERDGDPTTRRLEERVASMLGKDAALFFPSGVMANQAAIRVLTAPATEVLVDATAHIVEGEIAGLAALNGVQIRPVRPSGRVMHAGDLARAIRQPSRYDPALSAVCIENTHNSAGGVVTAPEELRAIADVAHGRGLPVHLDGARLWNAAVALGTSPAELAAHVDTVMVAFSKGLGAPIGAAVAAPASLIDALWTARKLFGGAMRQSGVVAAAALYGIEHHYDRLAEDHRHARILAERLDGVAGASVVPPDTNIVMIDLPSGMDAEQVVAAAGLEGVHVTAWTPTRIRLVTHLDLSAADTDIAATVIARVLTAAR
ncbi:MAG TPA: threonine aldolase family protein, partial [Gemmatimonadaceae bacterium]|nr:threonine aldolase family protein [Gemmatimonadaceae bacterium]